MPPRMSLSTLKILLEMTRDPQADYYGLELSKQAQVPIGSLYPILVRLEEHGWLTSHDENIDAATAGRSPRKYYRLTALGEQEALREIRLHGFRKRRQRTSHA